MRYDVVVVGAGIIGANCSYQLAKNGRKTLWVDKNHVGFGASGASAAMLEAQVDGFRGEPFLSLALASRRLFPTLAQEIHNLTGIDIQFEQNGILQLALNETDTRELKIEIEKQKKMGLRCRWIDQNIVANEFPQLTDHQYGGALFEEDGQVNSEKFVRAVAQAALLKGATLQEQLNFVTLKIEQGRVTGIHTNTGDITAEKIILAAGAWTDQLLEPLHIKLGLEPIRGQLAVFDTPTRILPIPVYTRSRGYVTPKQDGYTLVGSTVEHAGFDAHSTEAAKTQLLTQASELLPMLANKNLRGMIAGLRPGSPDELPFLGPLPEHPNVIIAAGHYRNGILLAPVTGQIVSDLVDQKTPSISLVPFSSTRFFITSRA